MAKEAVAVFTEQLNTSNPVLTEMTDAMTIQVENLFIPIFLRGLRPYVQRNGALSYAGNITERSRVTRLIRYRVS